MIIWLDVLLELSCDSPFLNASYNANYNCNENERGKKNNDNFSINGCLLPEFFRR
jgi:hypothetical protein